MSKSRGDRVSQDVATSLKSGSVGGPATDCYCRHPNFGMISYCSRHNVTTRRKFGGKKSLRLNIDIIQNFPYQVWDQHNRTIVIRLGSTFLKDLWNIHTIRITVNLIVEGSEHVCRPLTVICWLPFLSCISPLLSVLVRSFKYDNSYTNKKNLICVIWSCGMIRIIYFMVC